MVIDECRLGVLDVLVGGANSGGSSGEQVVVQVNNLVGVAVMPSTGQPEIDMLDFRRAGVGRGDQPVVAIPASAAAVAAGRQCAALAQRALVSAGVGAGCHQ